MTTPIVVITPDGETKSGGLFGDLSTVRTMSLHDAKELDDNLGRRSNEDLTLSPALSIDNVVLWTEAL